MKITSKLKDYEIARLIWGSNNKEQCKAVKKLRKKLVVSLICEGWYELQTPLESIDDIVGLVVPQEVLEIK